MLNEAKKELKTAIEELDEMSEQFRESKEKMFAELTQTITEERGDLFDPSQENFIIT